MSNQKRDISAFMKDALKAVEEVEVKISDRLPNFVMKPVSPAELEDIQKDCTRTYLNPKTGQKEREFNNQLFMEKLAIASTVFPDLKNEELQKSYGVLGESALIKSILATPGEYIEWLNAASKVNGFDEDENLDDLIEEAKN